MKKEDYVGKEKMTVTLNEEDNIFMLRFDSVYADSRQWAIKIVKRFVDNICYCLSFIVKYKYKTETSFDTKFTYNIYDIDVREEQYDKYIKYAEKNLLTVSDKCSMSEKIDMKISYNIDIEPIELKKVVNVMNENDKKRYLIQCYYRALGDVEYTSRYYNLFTIIEYVETNFKNKIEVNKIFSDEEERILLDNIRILISNDFKKDSDIEKRIINRISQVTKSTLETRAEKLYHILVDCFNIKMFKMEDKQIKITHSMVSEFIKMRNSLFHAKSLSEKEEKDFYSLTEELMILCGEIISKLINKNL